MQPYGVHYHDGIGNMYRFQDFLVAFEQGSMTSSQNAITSKRTYLTDLSNIPYLFRNSGMGDSFTAQSLSLFATKPPQISDLFSLLCKTGRFRCPFCSSPTKLLSSVGLSFIVHQAYI